MATLYELTGQFKELLQMIEDGDYEYQDLVDTFEAIEGEIEYKADGYAKVIKEIEGNVATIKAEIDRLSNKKDVLENSIKTMKQTLENAMKVTGKTKFKTDLFSFNIQKNPARLVITGEVPEQFLIPQEPKVDNKAIKELLKQQELPFAHLEQSESLRIR
jgi:DNA-binding FrmR family transcriptional regulator